MSDQGDDYVYDEATGEWLPASELAASQPEGQAPAGERVVKDAAGNVLADGEIDCRHESIKGLVLRTEFVRKR